MLGQTDERSNGDTAKRKSKTETQETQERGMKGGTRKISSID
jgi:hypothetical protein